MATENLKHSDGVKEHYQKQDEDFMDANDWCGILEKVRRKSTSKFPENRSILVLGSRGTGKGTLFAKFQGLRQCERGSALEYMFIKVNNIITDDTVRLGVYIFGAHQEHSSLLRFALNTKNYKNTLVVITLSLAEPWSWPKQLNHWYETLKQHLDSLDIPSEERAHVMHQQVCKWLNYQEPGSASLPVIEELPPNSGILQKSLGIDMIVLITKTDCTKYLESHLGFNSEHFDFMQQFVRRFAIEVGAAVFYVSAKENKNCDVLCDYLAHRIYGIPYTHPAVVVDRELVVIPAGWDNLEKISILYESMHSFHHNANYFEVIKEPSKSSIVQNEEEHVPYVSESAFLQLLKDRQNNFSESKEDWESEPKSLQMTPTFPKPEPPSPSRPEYDLKSTPTTRARIKMKSPSDSSLTSFFSRLLNTPPAQKRNFKNESDQTQGSYQTEETEKVLSKINKSSPT